MIFFKGWRNHGEHGFFRRQAFEEEQLETIVETGGIANVLFEKGEPRSHREPGTEFGCFGAQPAAVRDNRIDLTAIRDVPERLRQMPRRPGGGWIAVLKNSASGPPRPIRPI